MAADAIRAKGNALFKAVPYPTLASRATCGCVQLPWTAASIHMRAGRVKAARLDFLSKLDHNQAPWIC